jgi:hypothetical protein
MMPVEQQMFDTVKASLEKMKVPAELIQKIQDSIKPSDESEEKEGESCGKCPKCGYDLSKEKPSATAVEVTVEKKAPSRLQGMLDMLNNR